MISIPRPGQPDVSLFPLLHVKLRVWFAPRRASFFFRVMFHVLASQKRCKSGSEQYHLKPFAHQVLLVLQVLKPPSLR